MPKKAIDYSDTMFYKIVCKDLNIKDIYVGHTTNFRQQREHGGWENWDMFEICRQSCINSLEAHTKERSYIETLHAGTLKEWTEKNKDKIKENSKLWYEENKDRANERNSIYYQENKDKIKAKNSLYYQANKDNILEHNSLYYQSNREKLRELQNAYGQKSKDNKKECDSLYRETNKKAIKEKKKLQYQNQKLLKQQTSDQKI